MFHWKNENTLTQETISESALYAVALPSKANASLGGIRPQGQYPASPFSPAECDEAKQGIENDAPVNAIKRLSRLSPTTGTIAATVATQSAGTNGFPMQSAAWRGERWAICAGRTGSVAYLLQDMSLRGNDGYQNLSNATAMGASATRCAMFAVMHG